MLSGLTALQPQSEKSKMALWNAMRTKKGTLLFLQDGKVLAV